MRALAQQVGMEFVELGDYPIDRAAVAMVPEAVCRRHTALPDEHRGRHRQGRHVEPGNVMALDDIRAVTRLHVVPVVADAR